MSLSTQVKPDMFELPSPGLVDPKWKAICEDIVFAVLYGEGGGPPREVMSGTLANLVGAPSGWIKTTVGRGYQTETATALTIDPSGIHQLPDTEITVLHFFQSTGAFDGGGRILELPNGLDATWSLLENNVANTDIHFRVLTTAGNSATGSIGVHVAGDKLICMGRWDGGTPQCDILLNGRHQVSTGSAIGGTLSYDASDGIQIGRRERFTQEAPAIHILSLVWKRRLSDDEMWTIFNDPFGFITIVGEDGGLAAAGAALAKSLADSFALAEAISNGPGKVETEAVALAEAVVKAVGQPQSDNPALADAISKGPGLTESEAVAIAEAIVKGPSTVQSDSSSIADSLGKNVGKVTTDAMTLADTLSALKSIAFAIADSLGITDAVTKAVGVARSETATISDSLSRAVEYLRSLSDTIGIVDVFSFAGIGSNLTLVLVDAILIKDFGEVCIERALSVVSSRLAIIRLATSRLPIVRDICRIFGIGGDIQ